MKKKVLKFSFISAVIGVCVLLISYFCFHFVTDEGITFVWHAEAGKPYVTLLIAIFGVLFMFAAAISLLYALIFCDVEEKKVIYRTKE